MHWINLIRKFWINVKERMNKFTILGKTEQIILTTYNYPSLSIPLTSYQSQVEELLNQEELWTLEPSGLVRFLYGGGGKPSDTQEFQQQLRSSGLFLKDVMRDGNCLFRAIVDQLEDNEQAHLKYRDLAINYLSRNKVSLLFSYQKDMI